MNLKESASYLQNRWFLGAALAIVIGLSLVLRVSGLGWDGYEHFHPDERYISWVAATIEFTGHESLAAAWDPQRSKFNPYYWPEEGTTEGIVVPRGESRRFAYGHLPLYAAVALTRLVEQLPAGWVGALSGWHPLLADLLNGPGRVEFDHLTAVGRALTALVDAGSVLLVFFLGRRLFGPGVGLLAASFLALNVMHVQLAHFFIFDTYTTFFVLLSLLSLVTAVDLARRAGGGGRPGLWLLFGGVAAGLAVGSKFSAVMLGLPLLGAAWLIFRARFWRWGIGLGAAAFLGFALTNPFALLDHSCRLETAGPAGIELPLASCFLDNILRESTMVRGDLSFPFTRQYDGTLPFLYPVEMQLRWGMGWPLGLAAFLGFGGIFVYTGRRWWQMGEIDGQTAGLLLVLAWCLPFFLSTATFTVKFMRYLQPLVPFLMVFAAWGVLAIRPAWLRRTAVGGILVLTGLYALAFVQIYRQPHPWIVVSEWIYDNVPAGGTIAVEVWDEPLPATLERDGQTLRRGEYEQRTVNWLSRAYAADGEAKLEQNLETLAAADVVIVASNRSYGVVPRLPDAYPLSSRYFPRLFDGSLGFEPVLVVDRTPMLGGWHIVADTFSWPGLSPPPAVEAYFAGRKQLVWGRADESFTVYDHPLAIVFENRERFDEAELRARLFGSDPDP